MKSKWQQTHNYQQLNLKKKKKVEQEQNHRNGDHMEGYQWGGGMGEWGEMVKGIRSIIGSHKIDRGRLRIV